MHTLPACRLLMTKNRNYRNGSYKARRKLVIATLASAIKEPHVQQKSMASSDALRRSANIILCT